MSLEENKINILGGGRIGDRLSCTQDLLIALCLEITPGSDYLEAHIECQRLNPYWPACEK